MPSAEIAADVALVLGLSEADEPTEGSRSRNVVQKRVSAYEDA
jgi:hypothetical protein